ncbi:MAG: molybdopterin-guanine dinucleotide biosynthesis protein B [Chloroflexi bacterium]|nr:molybdopterin-guanine dinucleotide biosynthesis protein B [Chloroflexota bacterium]
MPVPIVSFVGYSGSGKTSLLERIVPKLKQAGLRVAVVKHAAHGFSMDSPGTDSWRHCEAGSDIVVLTSPGRVVTMESTPQEPDLGAVLESVTSKVDIILVEGYKKARLPKVEVRASRRGPGLPCPEEELIAIVTGEAFPAKPPRFNPEDVESLVRRLRDMAASSVSRKEMK